MSKDTNGTKDERLMAGLAHGSILLGPFTGGIGGILTALIIWLLQREKSAYVAVQALQAVVYQILIYAVVGAAWCCWGFAWTAMILGPVLADPVTYADTLPAGFWVGLVLMVIPAGLWALTILYGLWAAIRCLGGHDFRYVAIGRWVKGMS